MRQAHPDPGIRLLRTLPGGMARAAMAVNVSRTHVYTWPRVPAELVKQIAAALLLHPHELRPDLYAGYRMAGDREDIAA